MTTHPHYLKVEFSNADDESLRDRVTQEFVKTDKYSIAFATSALGQGIDKSNIRVQISCGSPREPLYKYDSHSIKHILAHNIASSNACIGHC